MIGERAQRVETVTTLEGRGRRLLIRVRGHQRRVQVDHQRVLGVDPVIGCLRTGRPPRLSASGATSRSDGRQRFRRIRGQRRDQPRHRRIGRHKPEHAGLGAQNRDIGQTVPADRERDRQIEHHLAGIMLRQRLTPRRQRTRQRTGQARSDRDSRQDNSPSVRHDTRPTGVHGQRRIPPRRLAHQNGAPPTADNSTFDKSNYPWSEHHSSSTTPPTASIAVKALG
jgi:hypothetical protein